MTRNLSIIAFATVLCCAVRADNLFLSVMGDTGGGADLTTGLAAWWTFTDLQDSSGHGNHLEKSPLCTATNGVAYFPGIVTNYIRTMSTNFCSGATNLVVSFWAKSTDTSDNWPFKWQANMTSSADGPELQFRPDYDYINCIVYRSGSYVLQRGTNVPDSIYTNWTHYAFQWAAPSNFNLWVNGVELMKNPITATDMGPTNVVPTPLYIGNSAGVGIPTRVFRGWQTRYRIFTNRPFSTTDVTPLFQEGSGQ